VKPVFIFGAERSGTTLLGSILGTHSRCVATPESQFTWTLHHALSRSGEGFQLERAIKLLRKDFRFRLWNIEITADDFKDYQVTSYAEFILAFVTIYTQSVGRPNADFWIDHTPGNIRIAAFLRHLFPEAKFIHIVRDGRAVAASIKVRNWGIKSMHTLSKRWAEKVGYGAAAEGFLGSERVLRVHYEALVQQAEETVKELCAFLDVPFENEMITGKGFALPQYTRDMHSLVGQPPDAKRVDAWRESLTPKETATFEYYTKDMLLYFGYQHLYEGKGSVAIASRAERNLSRVLDVVWFKWRDLIRRSRKRKKAVSYLSSEGYQNR
jgi:hypothetical protein